MRGPLRHHPPKRPTCSTATLNTKIPLIRHSPSATNPPYLLRCQPRHQAAPVQLKVLGSAAAPDRAQQPAVVPRAPLPCTHQVRIMIVALVLTLVIKVAIVINISCTSTPCTTCHPQQIYNQNQVAGITGALVLLDVCCRSGGHVGSLTDFTPSGLSAA